MDNPKRFFTVEVRCCYECPHADQQAAVCRVIADQTRAQKAFSENRFKLTDSCPAQEEKK